MSYISDYLNNLANQITGINQAATNVQHAIAPPPVNQPAPVPVSEKATNFYNGISVIGGTAIPNKYFVWGVGVILSIVLFRLFSKVAK